MTLRRREALALASVAIAASAAGLFLGPRLLDRKADDAALLKNARFSDLAGNSRSLADWRGKVVLLNFWATWCGPCREEIPMLMDSRRKYLSSGFEVVGIAIDSAAKVSEYAAEMKIDYPVLVADSSGLDLMRGLGNTVGGLPYTVVLSRAGTPSARKLGALTQPELDAIVLELLRESTT